MSGSKASRLGDETPKPTTRPSFTMLMALAMGAMNKCTRPLMVSVNASGMPLYGTCTMFNAAAALNCSAAKCVPLPTPAEEKLSCPGLALATARKSFSVFTPSAGAATSTYLEVAVCVMPDKSRVVSYGSLLYIDAATACADDTDNSV